MFVEIARLSAAGEVTGTGDDPSGLLMRLAIDSFAGYEAALIATRTRSALAAKRRRGERVSRFPPERVPLCGRWADSRTRADRAAYLYPHSLIHCSAVPRLL